MRRSILLLLLLAAAAASAQDGGWIRMFDGKTLNGWKASEHPENWKVIGGVIDAGGPRSHLFYMERECGDCEFKADVKLARGSNSGMYFRAEFMTGWPRGYEAQLNNSFEADPRKTGSLYRCKDITERLIPDDDTWFTQHVIARGNHIVIQLNGRTVVDFVDGKNTYTKGYLALQQHDPGSHVQFRNLMMRVLK